MRMGSDGPHLPGFGSGCQGRYGSGQIWVDDFLHLSEYTEIKAIRCAGWNKLSVLRRVSPIQYDTAIKNGRTQPSAITCELPDGNTVEVVAKFSAGCDQGNVNLAREVISACLAGDLCLPVPEPFLVETTPEWIATIPDIGRRVKAENSSPIAFGSRLVIGQFGAWGAGNRISESMLLTAAGIFVFDCVIQNPDRRLGNPNCLVRGDELRIFDHELAFSHKLVIGWKPPWHIGGLKSFETNGNHIFREGLRGRSIDYTSIRSAWEKLTDNKIGDYENVLPVEWSDAKSSAVDAAQLIKTARDNIDAVLEEVRRVLK